MVKRVALLTLCLVGCSSESLRVRDARNAFYSALSRHDYTGIRAAVAAEYVSVDRGRFFGFDSLIADVTLLEQESLAVHYAFSDSAIRVDPPLAWIVYRGRKILTGQNFADTAFTVESAMFKRDGAGWKLTLLHRTPVADGAGYFGPDTVAHRAAELAPSAVQPTPASAIGRPGTANSLSNRTSAR